MNIRIVNETNKEIVYEIRVKVKVASEALYNKSSALKSITPYSLTFNDAEIEEVIVVIKEINESTVEDEE